MRAGDVAAGHGGDTQRPRHGDEEGPGNHLSNATCLTRVFCNYYHY